MENNITAFSLILKEINYRFSAEEFVNNVSEADLNRLLKIDYDSMDNRVIAEFFNSYYFYAKKLFAESLKSSFSVVEFLIRNEYSKTSVDASSMSSNNLLKWARNRNYISKKNFNYLQALRETRNKIVHYMTRCLPEEAKLSLIISTNILRFFSQKNKK